MNKYLLDTSVLGAYVQGRQAAVKLVDPWVLTDEVVTSILVYGEVTEYFKSLFDFPQRQAVMRNLLHQIHPIGLTHAIMERYADIRRALRPHGQLIGDIDTLIAATALEHNLTLVTADSDFTRVPNLSLLRINRKDLTA